MVRHRRRRVKGSKKSDLLSESYSSYTVKQSSLPPRPPAGGAPALKNDEGIAYGLVAVIAFIVIGSLLWVCFTPAINGLIDASNAYTAEGMVGVQTAGAMKWSLAWFAAIPVLGLIGIAIWAYIRALEESPGGG